MELEEKRQGGTVPPIDAGVVCCIERGSLEYKGLCMILSLRKFWGQWKNIPIYIYSPRKDNRPSEWARDLYLSLGATLVEDPLNSEYLDYPLANKPLSMAHAEKHVHHEALIFLDSDILCWRDPSLFETGPNIDLAMVVDSTKTVASSGPDDQMMEPMWKALYSVAGVKGEGPYVTTHLTGQRVRGWWCTGIIFSRRRAGLMEEWLRVFKCAISEVSFRKEAMYLREQMTFCAVAAAHQDRFAELPLSYNYPIQNHYFYRAKGQSPEQAVLWHYQPYLNRAFSKLARRIDTCRSQDERLREAERFIMRIRTDYENQIAVDSSLFMHYRRKLALGARLRKLLGISKPTDPEV